MHCFIIRFSYKIIAFTLCVSLCVYDFSIAISPNRSLSSSFWLTVSQFFSHEYERWGDGYRGQSTPSIQT